MTFFFLRVRLKVVRFSVSPRPVPVPACPWACPGLGQSWSVQQFSREARQSPATPYLSENGRKRSRISCRDEAKDLFFMRSEQGKSMQASGLSDHHRGELSHDPLQLLREAPGQAHLLPRAEQHHTSGCGVGAYGKHTTHRMDYDTPGNQKQPKPSDPI